MLYKIKMKCGIRSKEPGIHLLNLIKISSLLGFCMKSAKVLIIIIIIYLLLIKRYTPDNCLQMLYKEINCHSIIVNHSKIIID